MRDIWGDSKVVDPEEFGISEGLVDAELRIYDDPPGGATGFSTGFHDFVLFTTGDAEVLGKDELAAILAHEDAHASVYFDGLASVIAPIISSLTFTGQNVFFAALEFGRREFRADRYAAETVSEKAIVSALKTMRDELVSRRAQNLESNTTHSVSTAVAFSSFAPKSEDLSWSDEIFGLYFGPYTMTRAHPTINARIDYIENQ